MWVALALFVALHGLIHVMGFAKAFGASSLPLTTPIGKPLGVAWLVTAVLMLSGAVLIVVRAESWWLPLVPGLLLSQGLILSAFADAKFGTIANLLIAIAIASSFAARRNPNIPSTSSVDPSAAAGNPGGAYPRSFGFPRQADS
ncbi:MAG TPA: hypothetical protein VFQ35_19085 [Polyangiaceae bacterium]|nr:hypothetical protein [Polyangiaceae bacterium]